MKRDTNRRWDIYERATELMSAKFAGHEEKLSQIGALSDDERIVYHRKVNEVEKQLMTEFSCSLDTARSQTSYYIRKLRINIRMAWAKVMKNYWTGFSSERSSRVKRK